MTHPARRAASFLTVLGGASAPSADAVVWFPAIGALLGLAAGGTWWVADRWWPRPVAAALVVAVDLILTGLLHVDGLADAADGLLPHLDRERRLAVMATPDVGAFGVAVVAAVLVLRWAALASMPARPLLVAALWCASRTAMAVVPALVRYARPGGLASGFQGRSWRLPLGVGLVLSCGLALGAGWPALVAVACAALAAAGVVALAVRRLGGFTGDVLGAAGVVAETVGLVAASAKWPGW